MSVSPIWFGLVVSIMLHVLVLGGYAQDAAEELWSALVAAVDPTPGEKDPKPARDPSASAPKPSRTPDDPTPPEPPTPKSEDANQPERPKPPADSAPPHDPTRPEQPPAPEPDVVEVTPGIEGGSATSMNWIGYAEYEEHLARLARQEQAAFDLESSGGGSRAATAEAQPLPQGPEGQAPPTTTLARAEPAPPPVSPTATQEPTPQLPAVTPAVAVATTPAVEPAQPTQPVVGPVLAVPGIVPDPTATEHAPTTDPTTAPAVAPSPETPVNPVDPALALPTPTPDATATPTPAPVPAAATAAPEVNTPGQSRPQVPPKVDAPGAATNPNADKSGPVTDGAKSDKQSAATSIIDVPASVWKNGKPLAREGLNIKTRRVELTTLTQVGGNYRNPQCDIYFDRTGKPVQVKIVESSGMAAAVDEPVVDTLYRWRASGKQIDQLKPGQMARFRVRIYLH